ncbi:type II toxin-antitoxin system RelE/ParE family toxin [Marinomonas sp. M1K-6]|uniref:Type II toxin-antitoxin system RelE/ParE family toxin n=2 Tax=Marinomonas profundi TaxID=2726122 RepID=A0A847QZ43_9GAMM|nr:type II toxin-antitoxin system RelE/ParE family toxin [Marinomonas profundi]UDV04382.1 type II toxin-antitoxin system RelE/ParE family toxin [Marinomonas profundi]
MRCLNATQGGYVFIYKTKGFCSLSKKDGLFDKSLIQASEEIQKGLVDADLGGALYKWR